MDGPKQAESELGITQHKTMLGGDVNQKKEITLLRYVEHTS